MPSQSNGGLPNSSLRSIEEAMGRLEIHKNYHRPYHPGQLYCGHYARSGICPYGGRCRFSHLDPSADQRILYIGGPERVGAPDCEFYLKRGTCSFGPDCKYHHPRDRNGAGPLLLNSLDLPIRPGEMCCNFYMKNGHCTFGVACKYHHPEPVTTGTSADDRHAAVYGPSGSSAVPLTDHHSAGGVTSLSLPASSNSSDQHLQRVKPYVPLVIYPLQGVAPIYGGDSYLGYTGNVPYARINGPAVRVFPIFFNHLPERPDQPECREFMSSGTCRYGSNCNYHHPKEKKAQMRTHIMRPLGFPLRPVVCSRYSMPGIYKYGGVTGRYVQPSWVGGGYYMSNNCLSSASAGFGGSFLYQRTSPSFHLPERLLRPAKVSITVRKPEVAAGKNQKLDTRANTTSKELSLPSVVEPEK